MVNYNFYVNTYHGCSIPADDFDTFSRRAEDQLRQYKRNYAVEAPDVDAEAMAVCAMAEVLAAIAAAQNGAGAVASASIGSVSVSYGSTPSIDLSRKGQSRELYDAACRYLDIYRG